MKKTLLSIFCAAFAALGVMADEVTYTDNLVVSVNEVSTDPQSTTVYFNDNGDGTCNFRLPNFSLVSDEDVLDVGTINIEGIALSAAEGGMQTFAYNDNLLITEGDTEGVEFWLGPLLGEIPLRLTGKVTAEKIFVTIDIDLMEGLGQIIHVDFGTDDFSAGISGAIADSLNVALYDLNGRRISYNQCGIVISEGRKMMLK